MIYEGLDWKEAAAKANLSTHRMRVALETAHVQRYVREQKQVFRAAASAKNIHRAVQIRDQDENRTAAIQAIRYLDGIGEEQAAGGTAGSKVVPGVVVQINVKRDGREPDETVIEVNPMQPTDTQSGGNGG